MARGEHDKRLRRWQSKVSDETRLLSELLLTKLVPAMQAGGFEKVDYTFNQPDLPVEGSEFQFERRRGDNVDVVYVAFDKNSAPRVQILVSRRGPSGRNGVVRAGQLVRRPWQSYHPWGRPWWLPSALWSMWQASRCVDAIVERMPQVFHFLETGERGRSVAI